MRLDRGADLSRRLTLRVFEVAQIIGRIQAHGDVGVQLVEALVFERLTRIDEHVHGEAIRCGFELFEPDLHHRLVGSGLAQVQLRQRTFGLLQQVDAEQRQAIGSEDSHQNGHPDDDPRPLPLLIRRCRRGRRRSLNGHCWPPSRKIGTACLERTGTGRWTSAGRGNTVVTLANRGAESAAKE
jgi:hypothetical protein